MFARQKTRIRGTFATNQTLLQITGAATKGVTLGIVQGLQLQLSRQFNQIYSLTPNTAAGVGAGATNTLDPYREVDAYRVGGRVQGQGQLSRILGPNSSSLRQFYAQMGDECAYHELTFALGAPACVPGSGGSGTGTTSSNNTNYKIIHATMTAASINVNSNDMLVNEGVQLVFADLDVDGLNATGLVGDFNPGDGATQLA